MINDILRAARQHEHQRDFDKAKELYNKALRMDPKSETAKRGLSRIEKAILKPNEAIGPGEMIRRMLNEPEKLSKKQRGWVEAIKETSDGFYRINFTSKQRAVIEDIYKKFLKRF